MNIYVVSWTGGPSMINCLDGAYCVFDALEKAQRAVFDYITEWGDVLLDTDTDLAEQAFFTAKGTWKIERMALNDTGL